VDDGLVADHREDTDQKCQNANQN